MNTTDDWRETRRELLEEGRRRVGPPPPVETVEALLRGELPEEEALRVREVLAYYPELVRVMTAEGSEDETAAALTDEQRAEDHAHLRQKLGLDAGIAARVVELPPRRRAGFRSFAIAAGVVLALAAGSFFVVQRWPRQQRAPKPKVLIADNARTVRGSSPPPPVILEPSTRYLLKPLYRPSHADREYRLELWSLGETPPRSVWRREGVRREVDGSFPTELSTDDLAPGEYRLVLYGIDGVAEPRATYTLRIEVP